jgi:glucoamylase
VSSARSFDALRRFRALQLSLGRLDGRALTTSTLWRANVTPDFVQFLRGEDLAAVSGDTVYADTRVNPDGTLDVLRWNRPQHDGSALRALAVLRWLRTLAAGTPGAVRPTARRPRVHRGSLATAVVRYLGR